MEYISAFEREAILSSSVFFGFPRDLTNRILSLRDKVFSDDRMLKELLYRCSLIYEKDGFDRRELRGWPLPEEVGSTYYYLMLLGGIKHVKRKMDYLMESKNIPRSVIEETIKDISSDIGDYERRTGGMPASSLGFRYFVNFGGEYFRLGRLAFHINRFRGAGDFKGMVLDVHIPGGEPMEYSRCIKSMKDALVFFKKYFPEVNLDCFACFSWLMDSRLPFLLPPDSNIVRFQKLFKIFPAHASNESLFINVFGHIPEDFNKVVGDTQLKRSLLEMIKNNTLSEPGGGGGILFFDDEALNNKRR